MLEVQEVVLAVVEVVEVRQVGHLLWHMDTPPPPPSLALWREREQLGEAGVRFVFPGSEKEEELEDGERGKKEVRGGVEEVVAHREVLVGASSVFCAHLGVVGSYRDQGEITILDSQPTAFARSCKAQIKRIRTNWMNKLR